jgi:hypothetical protein
MRDGLTIRAAKKGLSINDGTPAEGIRVEDRAPAKAN